MDTLNLDLNKRYTYADYLTWMDDVRRELHDGFIKLMSPAPSGKHQVISFNLTRVIGCVCVERKREVPIYGNFCRG